MEWGGRRVVTSAVARGCVSQMTISSCRRKVRTIYLYLYLFFLKGVECDRDSPDNGTVTVTCDVGNPLQGKAEVSQRMQQTTGNSRTAHLPLP